MIESKLIKSDKALVDLNTDFIHNFDVSIIISFRDEYDEFNKALKRNAPFFQRNGIEVVVVLQVSVDSKRILELIKKYPFINWKVVKSDDSSCSFGLNVGLKNSSKKYVLQIDPEMEFITDIIYQMRNAIRFYSEHYIVSMTDSVPYEFDCENGNVQILNYTHCHNIMVERIFLEQIGGFDEVFQDQDEVCNNACFRLDMFGIKKLVLLEARTIHRQVATNSGIRDNSLNGSSIGKYYEMFFPNTIVLNYESKINKIRDNLIYNWEDNVYAKDLCLQYLQQFSHYELRSEDVFRKKFKKILLCQAHNEEVLLSGFIDDMVKYFDGIIFLDDESTDETWKLAEHEKILLKVKKKREGFNDIENRNLLLNLAFFFQSEWFCFMDIDERFDERFVDFNSFENDKSVHVVGFRAVYLWNDVYAYKGDVPYSDNGILYVYRMFRPIGHTQINTTKKLHFMSVPYFTNMLRSNLLFKDYGSMRKKDREQKYGRYIKEDKQKDMPGGYDYMLNSDNLMKLSEIK